MNLKPFCCPLVRIQRATLTDRKKKYRIQFKNQEFDASEGEALRNVLLKNKLSPHNGAATYLNCKGLGSCGTCALEITGDVNPKTKVEKLRLNFPPHKPENRLRLACQIKVNSNLKLVKHGGFWGSRIK
jgi:ferredoxin